MEQCELCQTSFEPEPDYPFLHCPVCRGKYPAALLKSTCDPFAYYLKLKSGIELYFSRAEIRGEWVTIHAEVEGEGKFMGHSYNGLYDIEKSPPCPRGIDIRVDEILLCADAPFGS